MEFSSLHLIVKLAMEDEEANEANDELDLLSRGGLGAPAEAALQVPSHRLRSLPRIASSFWQRVMIGSAS